MLRHAGERTPIPYGVRYHDGTEMRTRPGAPEFTIVFRSPRAYWRTALYAHVGLLEAYFDGEVDIEGSLPRALAAGMEGGLDRNPTPFGWIRNRWHELTHSNSGRTQARANAEAHYALPPEFYKFWLDDPLMLYTCAYWKEGTRTPKRSCAWNMKPPKPLPTSTTSSPGLSSSLRATWSHLLRCASSSVRVPSFQYAQV